MSGKRIFLSGLVATLLGLAQVRGQGASMGYGPSGPPSSPPTMAPADMAAPTTANPETVPTLSSWMVYPRAGGCCGPVGADGPITWEIYVRSGSSFPIGGNNLGNALKTGWDIEGGGRTLFLNPTTDAAWVIDVGLTNIYQKGSDAIHSPYNLVLPESNPVAGQNPTFTQTIPVSVRSLNRTTGNLSLGYERWLRGSAYKPGEDGWNWRVGADFGGRFGTQDTEFQEIKHHTGGFGGLFVAGHTDLEYCTGACTYIVGLRVEYNYMWTDILQHQNPSDLQDLNVLINLGVRF